MIWQAVREPSERVCGSVQWKMEADSERISVPELTGENMQGFVILGPARAQAESVDWNERNVEPTQPDILSVW